MTHYEPLNPSSRQIRSKPKVDTQPAIETEVTVCESHGVENCPLCAFDAGKRSGKTRGRLHAKTADDPYYTEGLTAKEAEKLAVLLNKYRDNYVIPADPRQTVLYKSIAEIQRDCRRIIAKG